MEKVKELRKIAMDLPMSPGIYIMYNKDGEIIYIGKAKALKNRVSQYFGSQNTHSDKVRKMVSNVDHFDYTITDSEFEALTLECSLIKQNKPKYNILLKDDKGYSYIKITNEEWPRLSSVNQVLNDDATYIGPYMSSHAVKTAVDEVMKIFKLPNCNKNFSYKKREGRACLNYYINQCSAHCIGKIKRKDYLDSIKEAIDFLKGGDTAFLKGLKEKMNQASENLEFENAAKIRDKINSIKKLSQKQKVVSSKIKEQDIFAFVSDENLWCAEVFRFSDGKLYDSESFFFDTIVDENLVRGEFLEQYYLIRDKIPEVITIDNMPDGEELLAKWLSQKSGKKIKIISPKKGEQFQIVNLCRKNAQEKFLQRLKKSKKETTVLEELAKLLNLEKIPTYIESYDISNIMGSENVAGMVVFENTKPLKAAYRKFKIKNVQGQDDYDSMREVITRRLNEYEALKHENKGFGRLPDLILLDGGKGHVGAVKPILKARGYDVPVFGMVKDSKHRTRAIIDSGEEINISASSSVFNFVFRIQEEVHRFAIGYHRKLRSKTTLSSQLTDIPGVGAKRANILIKHFKTLERIKKADAAELASVAGVTLPVAKKIYEFFLNNN